MRERLDVAILSTACAQSWAGALAGPQPGGRLHLHTLGTPIDTQDPDGTRALANAGMHLRRFDACMVPVSATNLAWIRTLLSTAQGQLRTPVIGLVHQLKAAALNDLSRLGLADFVRGPFCAEEVRARVERLLNGHGYIRYPGSSFASVGEPQQGYAAGASCPPDADEDALCASILDRSGAELEAFAVASASRCATSRESFRSAKNKVIERFERAYITAALGRHSGNIAMAARAAQKHRRAFWALMRKHDIDAAPFRPGVRPNVPADG